MIVMTPMRCLAVLILLLISSGLVQAQEHEDGSAHDRHMQRGGAGIQFQNQDRAQSIVQRAFDVHGGRDAFSRLRFRLEIEGEETRDVSLVMAFKRSEREEDPLYQVVMFTEHPPDRKDVAFLGTFYRPGLGRENELWLYLPELRTTRRLMHQHGSHGHMEHGDDEESSDEFSVSELNHEELMPRWPDLDRHRLLGEDQLDGRTVYRIESVPRDPGNSSYARRVQWIGMDSGLLLRIEYFNEHGKRVKTQEQSWRQYGDSWAWDRVAAVNHVNGRRTLLEQTDVEVNLGLPDRLFSRRILSQGGNAFEARVGRHIE